MRIAGPNSEVAVVLQVRLIKSFLVRVRCSCPADQPPTLWIDGAFCIKAQHLNPAGRTHGPRDRDGRVKLESAGPPARRAVCRVRGADGVGKVRSGPGCRVHS